MLTFFHSYRPCLPLCVSLPRTPATNSASIPTSQAPAASADHRCALPSSPAPVPQYTADSDHGLLGTEDYVDPTVDFHIRVSTPALREFRSPATDSAPHPASQAPAASADRQCALPSSPATVPQYTADSGYGPLGTETSVDPTAYSSICVSTLVLK